MTLESFVLHALMATLLGAAIGLERESHKGMAGLRTNALVCLGACIFVTLSQLLAAHTDPTRIIAQIVTGVGFLGGGVIIRSGLKIRGLNTAATIWTAAAVGSLVGMGYITYGALGAAFVMVANTAFRRLDTRIAASYEVLTYTLKVQCTTAQEAEFLHLLQALWTEVQVQETRRVIAGTDLTLEFAVTSRKPLVLPSRDWQVQELEWKVQASPFA